MTDGGVALITTVRDGVPNAMTASFFAESSHEPMLVRVAIAPTTLTHKLVREAGAFGISILACGQEHAALFCGAHTGRDVAKLDLLGMRWTVDSRGVVLLRDAFSTCACQVVEEKELPDHTLFTGEITSGYRQTMQAFRAPLLVSDLLARAHASRA